jgi:hypothetical protein
MIWERCARDGTARSSTLSSEENSKSWRRLFQHCNFSFNVMVESGEKPSKITRHFKYKSLQFSLGGGVLRTWPKSSTFTVKDEDQVGNEWCSYLNLKDVQVSFAT